MKKQYTVLGENTGKKPLPSFSFHAVMFTWYEGDIIAATVENLWKQGVDSVFIIDNDSPDDTREVAEAHGAEITSVYKSNNFIEAMKVRKINELSRKIVEDSPSDHVWILYLDADELPTGPDGLTIREYLEGLDRQFRVVGSYWINHKPNLSLQNIPGFHPGEFQLFASYHTPGVCDLEHNKHQLIRHDKHGPEILAGPGFHWFDSAVLHYEPTDSLWNHHFNYRQYDITEKRLSCLNETRMAQRNAVARKRTGNECGECFWSRRYKDLKSQYECQPDGQTWSEMVTTPSIPKWYSEQELIRAGESKIGKRDTQVWLAERAFFSQDYDKALHCLDQCFIDGSEYPKAASLNVQMACRLVQLGRRAEGRQLIMKILQSNPSLETIQQLKPLL